MSDTRSSTTPPESTFFNHETKFQYEAYESLPLLVESYMMEMTVDQVKRGLLQLELLDYVKEKPENLKMYLELPGEEVGEGGCIKEMEESKNFADYKHDISRCTMVKMCKTRPHTPKSENLCKMK